jgi:hypothetical protein
MAAVPSALVVVMQDYSQDFRGVNFLISNLILGTGWHRNA